MASERQARAAPRSIQHRHLIKALVLQASAVLTTNFFDVSDELHPKHVSKIVLEVNDPANCATIEPEMSTVNGFLYDVHMCAVDNRDEATTLACGYFQSGIRVYDIRDPKHQGDHVTIPGVQDKTKKPGALPSILDASRGMLYSTCADGRSWL